VLELDVLSRRGGFQLQAGLTATPGSTTVIVGESGAGKTTLLRLAAGLDQPERGRIVLDGKVYADPDAGIAVPAWRRDVGYVAQDYALFPHLTVEQNVAFGLRAGGASRKTIGSRVAGALRRAGIADLGGRRPSMLSGGQQQRAALARALVLDPRLLLLDEPHAARDLQTRRVIRSELRELLHARGCVTLYVTPSPIDRRGIHWPPLRRSIPTASPPPQTCAPRKSPQSSTNKRPRSSTGIGSRDQSLHNVDFGRSRQSFLQAVVLEGQPTVVEAHEMN
jgi:molybdate transport system ATP-binding protein